MMSMLEQVARHGAPAQAARASELRQQLERDPTDAELLAAARQLIDGFLHDPYLTR